ncbi:probable serine/threonine-protein kinase DDB_G0280133 [Nilaparvata lugens]|uniref:probable serine/threonine-protein kinase DDB_G0280133 n=1 Tax=Nilaparvata lugens TaxID=108931 RepID=UPI00193DE2A3|nr:probable serine/threonine-protein kinase DDB_G0280133 [Nilaparvata lugens]
MILSIEAQIHQQYNFQHQNSNHPISSGRNDHHRYHHSQSQHQYNQQHQQQHQNQQQHQKQQTQPHHKHFHVKVALDGPKKQKYQQEKFNQNVQKQLQNHQLHSKQRTDADVLQKEVKSPRLSLPLVLSPEKIHAMDLDPAITVVEPPHTEHKKTSEVKKRQFSYDAAIASLFQEALKVAGSEPSQPASTAGQFTPLPAAQPIYKFKPVAAEHILHNPRPFHVPPQLSNDFKSQLPSVSFQHQQVEEKQEDDEEEEEEEEYQNYAAKYQYGYRVVDDQEGSDFGQTESRDGDMTRGHYHVRLPDGRMQRVKYWSDPSGFHAQISYDRDAVHI